MTDIVERLRHCADNCGDEYLRELSGRAADEIERLGRDYDTARDAHDRRVRELDAHCVEVARLRAEIERLRTLLKTIRNFPNLSTYYGTLIVPEIDAALEGGR